ncbi:MAG: glycosyltransferase [Geminicoccaceae bacterium]|nr:MAG: glycosyltransferase [Geminicoccaceae bacterium]
MSPRETVSIVVPLLDEAPTIEALNARIWAAADAHALPIVEVLFVDDGSSDASWQRIAALAERDERVRGLRLRRNFGKATALDLGIRASRGRLVVTMDADLQDDPSELPRFLAALEPGVDLVSGWKERREDPWSKTFPSKIFNRVTSWLSGVDLHDFNCGFKLYRREIFDEVTLYGELHRFVPVLAAARGYGVVELPVRHHARQHGVSKYGTRRLLKGFVDLLTVLMLTRFAQRPGHLFGGLGVFLGFFGFCLLIYLSVLRIFFGMPIGDRPLLLLGIMLSIIGVQVLLFGILAELFLSRTQPRPPTSLVAERCN